MDILVPYDVINDVAGRVTGIHYIFEYIVCNILFFTQRALKKIFIFYSSSFVGWVSIFIFYSLDNRYIGKIFIFYSFNFYIINIHIKNILCF